MRLSAKSAALRIVLCKGQGISRSQLGILSGLRCKAPKASNASVGSICCIGRLRLAKGDNLRLGHCDRPGSVAVFGKIQEAKLLSLIPVARVNYGIRHSQHHELRVDVGGWS